MDDILLIEVGVFSNMPTGFRILNFKKNKITKVKFLLAKVEKVFASAHHTFESSSRLREKALSRTLEKVLN